MPKNPKKPKKSQKNAKKRDFWSFLGVPISHDTPLLVEDFGGILPLYGLGLGVVAQWAFEAPSKPGFWGFWGFLAFPRYSVGEIPKSGF